MAGQWPVQWVGPESRTAREKNVEVVAGVDLGGTAVNYTLVNREEEFLIEGLCEHPSFAKQGPEICLRQIEDGLKIAAEKSDVLFSEIVAVGLDTPGPASAAGRLSAKGSTNFVHANWAEFDIREGLAQKLGKPVSYWKVPLKRKNDAVSRRSRPKTMGYIRASIIWDKWYRLLRRL